MGKNVIFYCFKESTQNSKQNNKVVKCKLRQAHDLFNEEYAKKRAGKVSGIILI